MRKPREQHNLRKHPLYVKWDNFIRRCYNPNNPYYHNYGGRGITVDDSWKNSFMTFFDWAIKNGYTDNLDIDRIDNDLGYSPDNCQFVNRSMNLRNRRKKEKTSSKYVGVSLYKRINKYVAYIKVNKEKIHLGYFTTEEEAFLKRKAYIIANNLKGFSYD